MKKLQALPSDNGQRSWSFGELINYSALSSVAFSGTNFRTMPLMQKRWSFGVLKPSPLKRWPRWASHLAQLTSVRIVPSDLSSLVVTFSALAGS